MNATLDFIENATCIDDTVCSMGTNATFCAIKVKETLGPPPLILTPVDYMKKILPSLFICCLFVWCFYKTVKMFKKFYDENTEPAILLELVFLTNIPLMLGSALIFNGSLLPYINFDC